MFRNLVGDGYRRWVQEMGTFCATKPWGFPECETGGTDDITGRMSCRWLTSETAPIRNRNMGWTIPPHGPPHTTFNVIWGGPCGDETFETFYQGDQWIYNPTRNWLVWVLFIYVRYKKNLQQYRYKSCKNIIYIYHSLCWLHVLHKWHTQCHTQYSQNNRNRYR